MSNLATAKPAGNAVAALAGLRAGLANVAASTPMRITDPFMRMGTDGVWIYGAENIEVEEGSEWAINPLSIRHGYSCWTSYPAKAKKKNELKGEVMVGAASPKPGRETLQTFTDPEYGDWEWKDQVSFSLMCVSGEDKGVVVLYKTSSVGGLNACGALIETIIKQLDDDPTKPVPVVLLENDSYTHKTYGKTYTPILKIVSWHGLPEGGMVDVQSEEDDAVTGDQKPETQAQTSGGTPAAEPEAEAPRRRRGGGEAAKAEPEQAQPAAAAPAGEVRRRRTRG